MKSASILTLLFAILQTSSGYAYTSADIGSVGAAGSSSVSGGVLTIEGSGADIWNTADEFHYYYTTLSGDGQITARIESVEDVHTWTKAGVMIRDSLADNSAYAFMLLRPTEGAAFQYRSSQGGYSDGVEALYVRPPTWLRLTREGSTFKSYISDDGLCWTPVGETDITMSSTDYVGVALTSNNDGVLAEAEVTNLSVETSVEAFNANCPRAAVDGRLAAPSQWVVQPGNLATVGWKYTFSNPNSSPTWESCTAGLRYGPDDPQCPNPAASPSWTQTGYNDSGWSTGNAGFGSHPGGAGDAVNTSWSTSNPDIWLRKTFTITSGQIDDLVLWARWDDGITVYINGVLATWQKNWTDGYQYLGLSHEARAALTSTGTNVIAVRVKNGEYPGWPNGDDPRYFDMGLGLKEELAQIPQTSGGIQTITELGDYSDVVREFMIEQGIPGGTLAVMKDDTVVLAKGFGYKDKALQTALPYDALMRLASVDKVVTKAAIMKLYNDNVIADLDDEVFPMITGLQPVPGDSAGSGVNDITVRHLLDHTSGIAAIDEEQMSAYEKYYLFGVEPSNWNKELNLRWLYSQDTTFTPGAQSEYSSSGYFILRYLVEYLTQDSIENYIASMLTAVGVTDIYVAHERLAGRDSREPAYINAGIPFDRWINLEDYLALGASAEAMVRFLHAYDLGTGEYLLDGSGNQVVAPGGGLFFGAMNGTWSVVIQRPDGISLAVIFNKAGYFDDIVNRLDTVTADLTGPGGVWGLDCSVEYDIYNDWGAGFDVSLTVTNNGSSNISGYELEWDLGAGESLDYGWNATFNASGSTLTASNTSGQWNGVITANGGQVTFGFQGLNSSAPANLPGEFRLNGSICEIE
ncbi:MAG TPA: serine hydrolase [Gammaproteobacteria bacterium]|nr:serine hydrolase [Gammaproteobacteria bacterium]